MKDNDDDYMTDEEKEDILDIMFPYRHDSDFNDDDDGVGSMLV